MILSDGTLRELLGSGRILLDPYDPSLVQPASVDVRLGTEFRVMRNSRLTHIDPFEEQTKLMETVSVPDGEVFVLHPGEFALGHTAEVVGCPDDIVGVVNGKSRLGRLGMQVHATAGFIDPGFKGTVVLELSNVSNLPILLRTGMKIAQLVFQKLDKPAERPYGHPDLKSKYQNQRAPPPASTTRTHSDADSPVRPGNNRTDLVRSGTVRRHDRTRCDDRGSGAPDPLDHVRAARGRWRRLHARRRRKDVVVWVSCSGCSVA